MTRAVLISRAAKVAEAANASATKSLAISAAKQTACLSNLRPEDQSCAASASAQAALAQAEIKRAARANKFANSSVWSLKTTLLKVSSLNRGPLFV